MRVELSAVSKAYGRVQALDRVSLQLAGGQIVALLGLNGAGKTTLLRCLAGIAWPDAGQIQYDELTFSRDDLALRKQIYFLPDFPLVFPEMTVLRHLGMVLRLYDADRPGVEDRVIQLLKEFDLFALAEAPLQTLSRGQLYKTALVGLMTARPKLWLLDEPFASGMDPQGINTFKEQARAAAKEGCTILYTTQILEVVERFSDKVAIIHKGELRAYDTVQVLESGGFQGLEELFKQLRGATV